MTLESIKNIIDNISIFQILYYTLLTVSAYFFWYIGKEIYSRKKTLYPLSMSIFIINMLIVSIILINSKILDNNIIFITCISFLIFSLFSSRNKAVLENKIRDSIYMNFKKLSHGDYFFDQEEILNFFLKDYEQEGLAKHYNNITIVIIYSIALLSIFLVQLMLGKNYNDYMLLSAYLIYFVVSTTMTRELEKKVRKVNVILENFVSSSEYKIKLEEEVNFSEPKVYIDTKNTLMILFDGGKYSDLLTTQSLSNIDKRFLPKLYKKMDKLENRDTFLIKSKEFILR